MTTKKTRDFIKKSARVIALSAALLASKPTAAQEWGKVKASISPQDAHALYITEGGATLTDKIAVYGFADIEATPQGALIPKSIYGEARITYKILDGIHAIAEHNDGTDYIGTTRLGIAIKPGLGKDSFTFIKLFPYETSGMKGPQASLFTSHKLTDEIEASILVDYSTQPKTFYIEPTLTYKIDDKIEGFIQLRSFGKISETEFTPYIGISYSL